ncbi:carbonic anhydrase [Iodidimonas nitroreducens]|uniref:Carbonic anhydrase n=1 Tax=Iodidimonas nitroreducens TaxID=1236968 RepID=A0A5A7N6Q2_9PROT|nr:carbonic anhydrase [Iodidimonas nitroreducens]GAK33634.1 carbonic anhydrase [alpha proteobacterium Q-1]GER03667.1 carbonic anhydrase [Iodidimonas nitroreducens]
MEKIFSGISTFQKTVYPENEDLFRKLAGGQSPEALFITCADSRVDPSMITQTKPGDLFICRNAGNIVPPHVADAGGVTATIEYAIGALNIQHLVVCGHTDCGAMKGAMDLAGLAKFPHVKQWLGYSEAALKIVDEQSGERSEQDRLDALIEQNVLMQLNHVRTHPYVAARLSTGRLQLHGWVYDIKTGAIKAYDEDSGQFKILTKEGYDSTLAK